MPGYLQFAAPTALEFFTTLVADDASLSLVEAAASIAQDEHPQLDTESVLAEVDHLAQRLRQRIPADAVPLQRLRWLNRFFFQELGFAGNVNNYYDPANSFLHAVLQTRRGIPISLAVLYIELATQVGLNAQGVSFPGHFLVKLSLQAGSRQGEVVLDPCSGHSLTREELGDMLLPYRRAQPHDPAELPLASYLKSAPAREVVGRMLRNLKEIYRGTEDWQRMLAVQQRLVVLFPQVWSERRDRGLVRAELGLHADAATDLAAYLEHADGAPDRSLVAQRLAALGHGGAAPYLH